jgi:hypothetical protein
VQAVVKKHQVAVEERRLALLDAYEAAGGGDLRALVGALVRPLAAKLSDRDGGREYLQIYAELMNRPQPVTKLVEPSLARWHTLTKQLLQEEATEVNRQFMALLLTTVELARRARATPRRDDRLFTSSLIDVVTGTLSTPVSDETTRLLEARRR